MASKYVLDAHAVIWYLEGNARLGANAKAVLDDSQSEIILPIISLCEAAHIIGKGRTKITTAKELLDRIDLDPRFEIAPLTNEILKESLALQISEMHDRLIVATTIHEQNPGHPVSLVTCDASITAYGGSYSLVGSGTRTRNKNRRGSDVLHRVREELQTVAVQHLQLD